MKKTEREFQFKENTIGEFQRYLLEERENSPATIKKYKTDLETFRAYLGENQTVTKDRLLEYKKWLLEHYAVASVNSMLVALNQYLEFMGYGRMKVKRIKVQTPLFLRKEQELEVQEYQKLLSEARNTNRGILALIMETICSTGIRISELRYITVEGVKRGRITANNKGKVRVIFLPDQLRKKLLYYIQKYDCRRGPVFVTRGGKPKDRSNIWNEMKKLARDAGVDEEKVFPHNLRHLFARIFYQTTKDLTTLADILGHSSLSVTRIYTKDSGIRCQELIDSVRFTIP